MSCTLLPSSPIHAFESSRKIRRARHRRSQILCFSSQPNLRGGEDEEQDGADHSQVQGGQEVIVVERYGNGTSKRYMLDEEYGLRTFLEEHSSRTNRFQDSHTADTRISWLPDSIKDFILPAGFPGSVSDDYLEYMLLQFPTNVTAWICHALVTSSLLKAVGVASFSGTTAAASAAAIRWVSKDGIGAVGRLFIGGRFGNLFDDDPKQWRMYADFIGSAGSIFDLSTQLYPTYFLPLASLGNLAKAVARGLKDPSFRVIQNHFAISGNLGEVAAKDAPGLFRSYPVLALTWMSMRLLHLWLRYQSLSVLLFSTINLKRARLLVKSHVLHSTVPGCVACNKEENILSWQRFMKPLITFGVSLEEMVGGEKSLSMVKTLLKLYEKEQYILAVNQKQGEFEVFVSFKVGATSVSVLRSVWQAYWLHENWDSSDDVFHLLAQSIVQMEDRFENFIQQLNKAGWDTHQINMRVPKEIAIDEVAPI
ncbi:protein root UVB sensitive 5 isoform X3 [Juglans microcarpa x Juglans regia]|uniref:protein root UVB sensitive 5 isoform X3 n=1 Tax=Juglans microcarpa x Juglans regia TaxID=2249226 RepID=UPI001B7EFDE1|nr:protein root UVB sensitive 5 isoform X3 [Juglans microcarpa x Juglans regia]